MKKYKFKAEIHDGRGGGAFVFFPYDVEQEFGALQASPFFRIWGSAAIDEILSSLHERVVLGPRA